MLHSVKTRLFAAALCGAMLLTTACGGSAAGGTGSAAASGAGDASAASSGTAETGETGGPKYGGTLTTYTSADPKSFDPAALSAWDQTIVAANILEGLVRLNPEGNAIEPGIAESWEPSEDGTVWTFHLRDAKFHNGRAVTAQDFKYSFERVANPQTASPAAWMLNKLQGFDENTAGSASEISGIKVVDDHTLELTLTEPYAPFVSMLSSAALAVVPQEAVEEFGDDFGQHVVAAGPFTVGQWNFNQDLTINAFEDYWAGRPYLDSVKFKVINDENTRIVEFDAGTLDIAWITPAHYDRLTSDPRYANSIGRADTLHTSFLMFNMEKEPFASNKALREAVLYALDTQATIDMLQGRASVANVLLPSGMLGSGDPATTPPYDVEKAKAKMAEAGYADGLPQTFEVITPAWNNNIKILEIYQQNLKEIGINIEIKALENSAYNEARDSGQFEIAWGNIVATYPDPDAMFYPLLHSDNIGAAGNYARYSNPEVDALIEQARASTDDNERASLYQQIEQLVLEDLPYAYLTHNIYVDICQPFVRDYCPSALDVSTYHRVWLDK